MIVTLLNKARDDNHCPVALVKAISSGGNGS